MAGSAILGLKKSFGTIAVPKGIDLEIRDAGLIRFLGPSGRGKSTVLRCGAGLEDVTCGKVTLDLDDMTDFSSARIATRIPYGPDPA